MLAVLRGATLDQWTDSFPCNIVTSPIYSLQGVLQWISVYSPWMHLLRFKSCMVYSICCKLATHLMDLSEVFVKN